MTTGWCSACRLKCSGEGQVVCHVLTPPSDVSVSSTSATCSNHSLHLIALVLYDAVSERISLTVHPAAVVVVVRRTAIDTVQRVIARLMPFAGWTAILAMFITDHEVIRHVAVTWARDVSWLKIFLLCQVKHTVGANRRQILVFPPRQRSSLHDNGPECSNDDHIHINCRIST